ncbi:MAG: hypothetical protein ACK4L7_01455 [Flavobacteriales bacterium]
MRVAPRAASWRGAPAALGPLLAAACLFALSAIAAAQADTSWVPYKAGMPLREGLYLSFREFRLNSPGVPLARVRDEQGLPVADLRAVVSRVRFVDDSGAVSVLRLDRIWGFCQSGVVHVAAGNGFYRIGLMGSLAHMAYEQSYQDWDPYLYGYGGATRTVVLQQLIDMENGRALPFTAAGMDEALAHDPVLQEEFRSLPKKERNRPEALFRFLRFYNERHPLLLPLL